ncbi:hypothetical protein QTO00_17105, partial [Vibrio sp. M260118]
MGSFIRFARSYYSITKTIEEVDMNVKFKVVLSICAITAALMSFVGTADSDMTKPSTSNGYEVATLA